jgi:hypothetical protein
VPVVGALQQLLEHTFGAQDLDTPAQVRVAANDLAVVELASLRHWSRFVGR